MDLLETDSLIEYKYHSHKSWEQWGARIVLRSDGMQDNWKVENDGTENENDRYCRC